MISFKVHDIADLLKQYFRELPEPLMTAKYSETFAKIFIRKFIYKNYVYILFFFDYSLDYSLRNIFYLI